MFEGKTIICYGMGKNIFSYVSRIESKLHIDFFCDSNDKFTGRSPLMDGRTCITPIQLLTITNPFVIITSDKNESVNQIETWLNKNQIENMRIQDVLEKLEYEIDSTWIQKLERKRIHKFIDLNMHGTTICNFHCDYCYVWRQFGFENSAILSNHTIKEIRNGLSVEKTGGICFLNMCARGETLLSKDIVELIYELLDEGHYVSVVTNGTITKNIKRILDFPEKFQQRFFFKLSFHFLELEKRKLLDVFWENVELIKHSKCSYTIEITPFDGLVDKIPEIKNMFLERASGAMPHISYARDSTKKDYDLLSDYSLNEYNKIWGQFGSKMFDLKSRHYGEKVKEYCHAGEWSYLVNILTGDIKPCYRQDVIGNIYDTNFKKFPSCPVGCDCHLAYCFNNHAFMAWGDIPNIKDYTYLQMRDREDVDGNHWVKEPMRNFMSDKLYDTNYEYEDRWDDYSKLFEKDRKPSFVIFNSPDYENIGDIAIAIAEKKFLYDYFPNYDVIEISCEQYQNECYKIIDAITTKDIVVITGGGNLGSLWLRIEDYTINIIQTFHNNKIIVFPQSIFFSKSNIGIIEERKLEETLNGHSDILITVREENSYKIANKMCGNKKNIYLVPDMAFYFSDTFENKKKYGGLICLREDRESLTWDKSYISKVMQKEISNIEVIDGLQVDSVSLNDREWVLKKVMDYLKSKEIVITDRLHCMILCALVGTPCIALDNISGKITGTFKWLSDCHYITIIHSEEEIQEAIRQVMAADCNLSFSLQNYFDNYAKEIERELSI